MLRRSIVYHDAIRMKGKVSLRNVHLLLYFFEEQVHKQNSSMAKSHASSSFPKFLTQFVPSSHLLVYGGLIKGSYLDQSLFKTQDIIGVRVIWNIREDGRVNTKATNICV